MKKGVLIWIILLGLAVLVLFGNPVPTQSFIHVDAASGPISFSEVPIWVWIATTGMAIYFTYLFLRKNGWIKGK